MGEIVTSASYKTFFSLYYAQINSTDLTTVRDKGLLCLIICYMCPDAAAIAHTNVLRGAYAQYAATHSSKVPVE